jgi:hypothetical protein
MQAPLTKATATSNFVMHTSLIKAAADIRRGGLTIVGGTSSGRRSGAHRPEQISADTFSET